TTTFLCFGKKIKLASTPRELPFLPNPVLDCVCQVSIPNPNPQSPPHDGKLVVSCINCRAGSPINFVVNKASPNSNKSLAVVTTPAAGSPSLSARSHTVTSFILLPEKL